MNTNKTHFKIFKAECEKWIDRLGLHGYNIYYFHEDASGGLAWLSTNAISDRVASIGLAKDWGDRTPVTVSKITNCAKHEILELLVNRAKLLAESRYTTKENIDEAFHEIVMKLEKLL